MVKRRKKKNKSRSHGYGSSKKNRGAGSRGGRGKAGRGKKAGHHKQTKEGTYQLGEKGFTSRKEPQNGINLRAIDQRIEEFVEKGYAEETDSGYVFYAEKAGYNKVLGKGRIHKEIEIHAEKFSDSAEKKIEESDSQIIKTEE